MWITRLMSDRCGKCKFSNAIKSFWCYFNRNFTPWLLVYLLISPHLLICITLFFCFYWFVLIIIYLLKILLTIINLSTLTVLQEILLSKIFVKILLISLLIFSRGCTYSFLRRISLFLILCLNVFSLKLNLLQSILLIVLSCNTFIFLSL